MVLCTPILINLTAQTSYSNMKKIILSAFLSFSVCFIMGQTPLDVFAFRFGNNGGPYEGNSNKFDNSGNLLTAGCFAGTINFAPNPIDDPDIITTLSSSGEGGFIQKLDISGNFLWVKKIPPCFSSKVSISVDAMNNVYITGSFNGTFDFNPGVGVFNLTSTGITATYLLKLTPNGEFVYAKKLTLGTTSSPIDCRSFSISVNESGVFISGNSAEVTATSGGGKTFLAKYSSDGILQYVRLIYGPGGTTCFNRSVFAKSNGSIYLTGDFKGNNIDFNPGSGTYNMSSTNSNACYIVKLDISGNFISAQKIGGISEDDYTTGTDCAYFTDDPFGISSVFITGYFRGTVDFDPGPGVFNQTSVGGSTDIFVLTLGNDGSFQSVKTIGGTGSDFSYSMALSGVGGTGGITSSSSMMRNINITGTFEGNVDFDPGPGVNMLSSNGAEDVFVLRLIGSSNALFVWAESLGSGNWEHSNSITTYGGNCLAITGVFNGLVDFNPEPATTLLLNANVGADGFIQKVCNVPHSLFMPPIVQKGNSLLNADDDKNVFTATMNGGTLIIKDTDNTGSKCSYVLVDAAGRKLREIPATGATVLSTDISNLSAGVYMVIKMKAGTPVKEYRKVIKGN